MEKITQKNYEAIKIYRQKEKLFELKGKIQTLEKENAKLKELLKDCSEYVKKDYGDYLTYTQSAIYQEISEVLGEE